MSDSARSQNNGSEAYFDSTPQDVHEGLPLQILRVISEACPVTPGSLGTKVVLCVPDLPRVFVGLAERPCSVHAGVVIYPI